MKWVVIGFQLVLQSNYKRQKRQLCSFPFLSFTTTTNTTIFSALLFIKRAPSPTPLSLSRLGTVTSEVHNCASSLHNWTKWGCIIYNLHMVFKIFSLYGRELSMNWETFLSEQPTVTPFSQSLKSYWMAMALQFLTFLHDHKLAFCILESPLAP